MAPMIVHQRDANLEWAVTGDSPNLAKNLTYLARRAPRARFDRPAQIAPGGLGCFFEGKIWEGIANDGVVRHEVGAHVEAKSMNARSIPHLGEAMPRRSGMPGAPSERERSQIGIVHARQKINEGNPMPAKTCPLECAQSLQITTGATAFGCPRDFLDNRFVYTVISPRARGLSIGINMNPDRRCNFDCIYCEVDHQALPAEHELEVRVMAEELQRTLLLISSGAIRARGPYQSLSNDLLQLRHVAFSGDGEPTLCPCFNSAVEGVVHVRARRTHGFFKLVLITNGTGLDLAPVRDGLRYFTEEDEIWVKLDAGTQAYMDRVNRGEVSLDKVLQNILHLGRQRPVIIQSLFPRMAGEEPPVAEIDAYLRRLAELKEGGARIPLVQIYSATRPATHPECGHLPLKTLSNIRQRIKAEVGLHAEVF